MVIEITWHDAEHTILWMTFPRNWDLTDYHQMVDEGAALIKAEQHTVHVVYDFRGNFGVPKDLITAARYAEKRVPANQGLVIFLKPNMMVKGFLRLGHSLNFKSVSHLYTADSVDVVLQLIDEHEKEVSGVALPEPN